MYNTHSGRSKCEVNELKTVLYVASQYAECPIITLQITAGGGQPRMYNVLGNPESGMHFHV